MATEIKRIHFDRNKHPGIDFEILPLESILKRNDLNHDPRLPHLVEFYLMLVCTQGQGVHTIDFEEFSYQSGSVITIRKDQIHQFHQSDAEGYLLLFTEEFVVSYLESEGASQIRELFNELLFEQKTQFHPDQFSSFLSLIREISLEYETFDSHTPAIIRNFLQALIGRMHRLKQTNESRQTDQKYIQQFLVFQRYVETHCVRNRSVQYYADLLHITTKTLNNITRAIIRKSAKNFIDDILLLKIKRLLINSDIPVKEIAYQTGFTEPTNLFKFFKRLSPHTPEEFRALHSLRSA